MHVVVFVRAGVRPWHRRIECEVDHHRGQPGSELARPSNLWLLRDVGWHQVRHERWVDVRDDGLTRTYGVAICELHAGGLSVRDEELRNRRVRTDFATVLFDHLHERGDQGCCTALPDHHAEELAAHGFKEREQRTTGHIGSEVKVHPPGRHECAGLW